MEPGRLVVLNGTSSSGKSTLATAFRDEQARRGEFWLLIGIDDALSKLPYQWVDMGLPTGVGERASDGLWFEDTPDGRRLRVGALARQLIDAYHRWVAEAVRAGMNVIVDDVVIDRETYAGWLRALDGLPAVWVAVRCPLDVVEAREAARGDRAMGLARAQHDVVHQGIPYALEIDTGRRTPDEAHDALRRFLGV